MKRRHLTRCLSLLIALLICQSAALAETSTSGAMYDEAYALAYQAEYAGLDDYIYNFTVNFDPAVYRARKTRSMTQPLREIATESYNFMMENYPDVAVKYADELGQNFGVMAPFVSDLAYAGLTDPEAANVFGELVAGALEWADALDYALMNANKNPHPEYAEYVLVTGRYTLLKSNGTAREILNKHLDDMEVKLLALEERRQVLQESCDRLTEAYQRAGEQYSTESAEMVDIMLNLQTSKGMLSAVNDKYEIMSESTERKTDNLYARFTGPGHLRAQSCLYNVVDNQTGEVVSAFCALPKVGEFISRIDTHFRLNQAGTVSACREIYTLPLAILNKNGLLYQTTDDCAYGNLTPSGNVLRVTRQTNVDYGDHLLMEIVDPNGTLLAVVGHAKPDTLYLNEIQVSPDVNDSDTELEDENSLARVLSELPFRNDVYIRFTEADGKEKKGLLDLSTCKVQKVKFDESMKQSLAAQLTEPMPSKAGNSYIVGSAGYTQINKSYKLDNAKSIVYGPNGLEIDLSKVGSGVKAIHQDAGGRYWVVTKSGYYYVLNSNWKARFKEPVQLGNDARFAFVSDGLLAETSEGLCLFDVEGECLRTLKGVTMDSQRGNYVGSNENGWFNVNTGEVMLVSLPESGVSVLE